MPTKHNLKSSQGTFTWFQSSAVYGTPLSRGCSNHKLHSRYFSLQPGFSPEPRIVYLTAYLASLLGCALGISNITCSNWAPGVLSLPHFLSTSHTRSVVNTYLPTTSRIQLLPTSAAAILVHATIIPLTWITARPPARLPCLCPCFLFRLVSLQQLEWFCYHVSQVMSFVCSNPPRLLSSEKCHIFPSAFWLQATPSSDYISFYSPSRNKNSTKAWILSFLSPPEPRMVSGIQ